MLRARLNLARNDSRAGADFDEALRLAPDNPHLLRQRAGSYAAAGHHQAAVSYYDQWLAKWPKSPDAPSVLNDRCWARAVWGEELDRALADCDAALAPNPRVSAYLDSRGLVRLRRGEFVRAIADYDAALRLQPKAPLSLYGRGMAKLRNGQKAEGEADLAAAAAIEPDVAEQAAKFGLRR